MKKLLLQKILLGLFLLPSVTLSQRIQIIDHGKRYRDCKKMSYYDFKDNCNKNLYKYDSDYSSSILFPHIIKRFSTGRFFIAGSTFPDYFGTHSHSLGYKEYSSDIGNLCKEYNNLTNSNWSDFDNCSEKTYKCLLIYLQKFEITSEYHKELHNYYIDELDQQKEIEAVEENVSKSIEADKDKLRKIGGTDSELSNLMSQKDHAVNQINIEFNKKTKHLEQQKKDEIQTLEISNYTEKKKKIIQKYAPQIRDLRRKKNKKIQSTQVFWDKKMSEKKQKLEQGIAVEISKLKRSQAEARERQIEKIKNRNNLDKKREAIESTYRRSIIEIDKKVTTLMSK